MPLVTSKEMLQDARKNRYAVGAFNAENMEMVKAIIAAAEELRAPVIIQTTSSTIKYGGSALYAAIVKAEAENAGVPVCMHLDHGSSYGLAVQCIADGYTSVMIDGSHESFEGNADVTRKVADYAHERGIPVEAELGRVGGKEDEVTAEGSIYTDVNEAVAFAERTGVDSLAIAIGTAHGFYRGTPVLDKERLSEIAEAVSIPLVLHGASGITDSEVADCVSRGISKVNFATELRKAYTDACRELAEKDREAFDPKAFGKAGMAAVTELVKNRMKVCGCDGRAIRL